VVCTSEAVGGSKEHSSCIVECGHPAVTAMWPMPSTMLRRDTSSRSIV
jgi:hypothetical protein